MDKSNDSKNFLWHFDPTSIWLLISIEYIRSIVVYNTERSGARPIGSLVDTEDHWIYPLPGATKVDGIGDIYWTCNQIYVLATIARLQIFVERTEDTNKHYSYMKF